MNINYILIGTKGVKINDFKFLMRSNYPVIDNKMSFDDAPTEDDLEPWPIIPVDAKDLEYQVSYPTVMDEVNRSQDKGSEIGKSIVYVNPLVNYYY